jgi:hypothetical protein
MEEADRHLRSAKFLRTIRRRRKTAFSRAPHSERRRHILAMEATVHSSMLLLAYAIELFLKAGLTRVYVGCSKQLFENDFKKRFGHDLVRLAHEIEYALPPGGKRTLRELQRVILAEGRYPFLSIDAKQDMARRNKRARRFWSDSEFKKLLALAESLRKHVASIDADSGNPAWTVALSIDEDGYFAFRCGGNLSPRIVVKYSTLQRRLRQNNRRALRGLILRNHGNPLLRNFWDAAQYRCVKL